ncbi:MAG: hypothetical protein VKN33_09465 [Candidatus Sericytochromatia bacterium]|nr:hypothetical protein [Candidatus Sericytochromatia bacterium]
MEDKDTQPEVATLDAETSVNTESSEGSAETTDPVEEASGDVRSVREKVSIKGIHPELLCQCPECDPDFVELQWFTQDESRKVKGDAMLFCGRSSRKYFTPVLELNAWIATKGGPRKSRRGEH